MFFKFIICDKFFKVFKFFFINFIKFNNFKFYYVLLKFYLNFDKIVYLLQSLILTPILYKKINN
jgi:hypothetical protein